VTFARYAALVVGTMAASLCAAWPALAPDSRPAAFAGALLAAINTLCAYFLAIWSSGRSTQAFFAAVLGGMLGRMVVMLAAVLVGILLLGLPRVPFVVSLLAYFVVFLVFELAVLSRRPAGAGAR
jgi:branched-subunit amino acid ABC-type transport system permease component